MLTLLLRNCTINVGLQSTTEEDRLLFQCPRKTLDLEFESFPFIFLEMYTEEWGRAEVRRRGGVGCGSWVGERGEPLPLLSPCIGCVASTRFYLNKIN